MKLKLHRRARSTKVDVVEEEEECTMSVQTGSNPRGVKRNLTLEDDTAGGRASGVGQQRGVSVVVW